MKIQNLFFTVCASIMLVSEICAMQLVTQRVPKSMHRIHRMGPMLQKRNFNINPDLAAVIWIVGGIMCANFIDGSLSGSDEELKNYQMKTEKTSTEWTKVTCIPDEIKNCVKQHQKIDQKTVKIYQNSSQKIPKFKLKTSEFKLLTDGSQQQRE